MSDSLAARDTYTLDVNATPESDARSETIAVMLVADDAYSPHLATTLRSIALTRDDQQVDAYVVAIGISDTNRDMIERSAPGLPLTWFDLDAAILKDLPRASGGTHNNAYGLLFAVPLLPDSVRRIVAIDSDTLVRSSLGDLWRIELGDNIAAGVRDLEILWLAHPLRGLASWSAMGLDGRAPYLNTGVILLDVERWKAEKLTEQCVDYLDRHGATIRFADQDVLNAVLVGRWRELPARWNVLGDPAQLHFAPTAVEGRELHEAMSAPRIVHYAGGLKPWRWDRRRRNELILVAEWDAAAFGTEFAAFYEQLRTSQHAASAPPSPLRRVLQGVRRRVTRALRVLIHGGTA